MGDSRPRTNDCAEIPSPLSSDDKMDTGSESFISTQNTPNSTLSWELEENPPDEVLRLQNPNENILRFAPKKHLTSDLSDSFVTKMSEMDINKSDMNQVKPTSILTTTKNHPLMGLSSPDSECMSKIKIIEDKDNSIISISSTEDDRNTNNASFTNYSPQRNTSKNNLYFSENFCTANSNIDAIDKPLPKMDKRKIKPLLDSKFHKNTSTPRRFSASPEKYDISAIQFATPGQKSLCEGVGSNAINVLEREEEFHTGVEEWCESPSQLRFVPNFELPIEMKSNFTNNQVESPTELSLSEERSLYQARLDPYSGQVVLKHTPGNRSGSQQRRKIQALPLEHDSCSLDSSSGSSLEADDDEPKMDPQDMKNEMLNEKEKRNSLSSYSDPIPEYTAAEELDDERSWIKVPLANGEFSTCDMRVIEPYKRVLSHGGYSEDGAAIIVVSACHLPCSRTDYDYVMKHLFLYALWTLERLVTEQYILVYLHHGGRAPAGRWIFESYRMVDRRLRKSLQHMYLVHPTFWVKSIVVLSKPFVSAKFFRKITYVKNLKQLNAFISVEPNAIPESVKRYDEEKYGR